MKPISAGGHGAHPPDDLQNDGVMHETSDVNVRAILAFGGIVALVTVVCAVIVWGVFDLLERQAAARDPKMSPVAMPASAMPRNTVLSPYFGSAPQPQLITDEPAVLKAQREGWQKQLHQYGWVEQATGVAHVPIEEAKKLILERGLPARASAVERTLGTHAPAFGEATSGRTIPTGDMPAAAPAAPQEPAAAAPPASTEQPAHPPAGRGGGA